MLKRRLKQPSRRKGRVWGFLLLATVSAFLVVPAAQAFAGTLTVNIEGGGSGEITSIGGVSGSGFYEGSPPIECTYESPFSPEGICETENVEEEAEPGLSGIAVHAVPAPGSEFVRFEVDSGIAATGCNKSKGEVAFGECFVLESSGNTEVTALFEEEGAAPVLFPLTVTKSGTGSGTVTSSPNGIDCGITCSAQFEEDEVVTLTDTPDVGSEFVEWTGECDSISGNECEVAVNAAKSVEVVNESESTPTVEFPLTVTDSGTGSGTVTSSPAGIDCGPTCSAEFAENEVVTLTPSADTGSQFVEWTGACSGSTACEVTMSAAQSVDARFDLEPVTGSTLTVWVTGQGTVTSTPSGLACVGEECTGTFEGPVALEAHPATGYAFAGWLGCKHTGPATCTLDVTAETEVTAVFVKEGTEGSPGSTGPAGPSGLAGPTGPAGPAGSQGATGAAGSQGPGGSTGPQGAAGAKGDTGAQGAPGPAGPQGPTAKVTCKVQQKGKSKVKVTCTVKNAASASSLSLKGVGWRLLREGHTYRHGMADGGPLQLDLSHLAAGRYQLHIDGHKGSTAVVLD